MTEERLQKLLAQAGIGSRRKCEDYIAAGRVTVDGKPVTRMGVKVDPEEHTIRFDGRPISFEKKVYYALNKPRGYVCTNRRFEGEKRALDLLKGIEQRIFPVGRLDKDSEGLIILTNDGEFADKLTHPRYEVPKAYRVDISGSILKADLERLQKGVRVDNEFMYAQKVTLLSRSDEGSCMEIVLSEGKKREVRRMFEALDHEVTKLVRYRIGSLKLGDLPPGKYRRLDEQEIKTLLSCAEPDNKPKESSQKPGAKQRGNKARRKRGGK